MSEKFEDSIYAVVAEAGSYSDYITWIAAAYASKVEAELGAQTAREESDAAQKRRDYFYEKREVFSGDFADVEYRERSEQFDEEHKEEFQQILIDREKIADEFTVLEVPMGKLGRYWP